MSHDNTIADRVFVSALMQDSYGQARSDAVPGSILGASIGGRRKRCLEKTAGFWRAMIFANGAHNGRPVPDGRPALACFTFKQAPEKIGATVTSVYRKYISNSDNIEKSKTIDLLGIFPALFNVGGLTSCDEETRP